MKTKFKSVGLEIQAYEKLKELAELDRRSIGRELAFLVYMLHAERMAKKPVRARAGLAAVSD
jgi:hypothetical protein